MPFWRNPTRYRQVKRWPGSPLGCGFYSSMSRKLWVRLFHCFEGVHREVALQRPLLAAPQCYLCGQRARTHLVGEHPHHPCSPLHLFKEPLQHVRRASAGMVAPRVAKVDESVIYASLKHRNRLGVALLVERDEFLGQGSCRLLSSYLEDRRKVLCYLAHLTRGHMREDVALEVNCAPLPLGAGQLACDRTLYALVVV